MNNSSSKIHLWLRSETKPLERRTLLPPTFCKKLLEAGFQITVEKCKQRIFPDSEYQDIGCSLVDAGSWTTAPTDAYICGLKELDLTPTTLLYHRHIYFAHCFKGQQGWKELLSKFSNDGGQIFDLEFLFDAQGRRVAAFGFHAGFVGMAVGLDAWAQQQQLLLQKQGQIVGYPNIVPFETETALIDQVRQNLLKTGKKVKVLVMGALGRCGQGAVAFLKHLASEIPSENILLWDLEETKKGGPFKEIVEQVDVFVNCIYLSSPIPPFVTNAEIDLPNRRLSVIADVSCDVTSPYNPLPVYSANTTFDKPSLLIRKDPPLEVIAIDHLPSALPREASEAFCSALFPYLLELRGVENSATWNKALSIFEEKRQLALS